MTKPRNLDAGRPLHYLARVTDPVRWWSSEQVAAYLGTTAKQVRNMRQRGQLPPAARLPGVGLRWSEGEVRRWAERVGRAAGLDVGAKSR